MGTGKQLRSVEKTRMGELKKLKYKSEGSLEQLLYNFRCFFLTLVNPSVNIYVADFLPNSARLSTGNSKVISRIRRL